MAVRDTPCSKCGALLFTDPATSLPAADRVCRPCRNAAPKRGCNIEGCVRAHASSGYCIHHWLQFIGNSRGCDVTGCNEPHIAKGMCRNHYRQARYAGGDPRYQGGGENNARGRARRNGVAYEPINRIEVFDRDGWICGICREPVDRDLTYPDRMSASLDHVVPITRGGPHLYSNVQCAHFTCNSSKADHVEEGGWVPSEMLSIAS